MRPAPSLALRSHEIWRDLERETGESLLLACGFVAIDSSGGVSVLHGKAGFVQRTVAVARKFGIPHETLAPDEVMRRHPGLMVSDGAEIYYEPGGGLVPGAVHRRADRASPRDARRGS